MYPTTYRTKYTEQNIPYQLRTNYTLDDSVSVRVRVSVTERVRVRVRAEWATAESLKHPN